MEHVLAWGHVHESFWLEVLDANAAHAVSLLLVLIKACFHTFVKAFSESLLNFLDGLAATVHLNLRLVAAHLEVRLLFHATLEVNLNSPKNRIAAANQQNCNKQPRYDYQN